MTTVYEISGFARRTAIASFAQFDDAIAYVTSLKPVCLELDADHPGCADAYLPDTRLIAVETPA